MSSLPPSCASPTGSSSGSLPRAAADLLPVVIEQLEAVACAEAYIEGPPELEVAVADTLRAVRLHIAEAHAKIRSMGRSKQQEVCSSDPCIVVHSLLCLTSADWPLQLCNT